MKRVINEFAHTNLGKGDKIPIKYINELRLGTTVATNALLEKKGDETLLFVSHGFKDILVIGNQTRPDIFDLYFRKFRSMDI
mmetsp:Transcript_91442/g.197755  ORF Transcript_91442/g.197755 Transcript_91442/m.197755 type:complete len:82 (-) Transcript_91442:2630-2875(-)